MQADKYTVPASMLSPSVDPERLGFDDTSELDKPPKIIADGGG